VNDLRSVSAVKQPAVSEVSGNKGRNRGRRRLSAIHAGPRHSLDAAVEARCDTEHASEEFQVRRPDVQDLFAWCTRRQIRQMQTTLRSLDERVRDMEAELRGTRPIRRAA